MAATPLGSGFRSSSSSVDVPPREGRALMPPQISAHQTTTSQASLADLIPFEEVCAVLNKISEGSGGHKDKKEILASFLDKCRRVSTIPNVSVREYRLDMLRLFLLACLFVCLFVCVCVCMNFI